MRRILAAVAVLATLAASACASADPKPAQPAATKIDVGVIPIVDVAPIYLAKKLGYFARRGIDLTLTPEQGGGAVIKGVAAGKYQFGFSNLTSLMAAAGEGAPLKVVACGVASTGRHGRDYSAVVVPFNSPIRTAKDLAGKRIAVNALKNVGDTTVRESVRLAGGDANHLQFEAMPFPTMPGLLQSGKIDAAWVVEPQLSEALTQGSQVVASNFVDTAPNMTVAGYFTTLTEIAQSPDLVKRFTAAIDDGLTYADTHPDAVRAIIGTYTPINDVVRSAMILPDWPTVINRASVERLAQLGRQDGILTKPAALDQLLPAL